MKRPSRPEGAEREFDQKLKSLNLDNSGSITLSKAGAQGDEYFVEYPIGSGRREFLNMHLKTNANTRQPERALRVYYFWSDSDNLVVIGRLGHAKNQLS
jgi:hypothetical protein